MEQSTFEVIITMELLLNELSAEPLADNTYKANERMMLFAKAVKKAKEYNFNSIRSHYSANEIKLTTEYTLHNWLTDKKNPWMISLHH